MMQLDELTEDVFRKLYLDELLTEQEIADRYGTYQVKINRLRKKWGIPTLGKTGRLEQALPNLTPEQDQLVIGSLLGDAWCSSTSVQSARFGEGHCLAQEPYLQWKHDVLLPFALPIRPGTKTDKATGKIHHSKAFTTHSCPQLRAYYDLFYPGPSRIKVFPSDLHRRMTPLVLAVWYMDDGSVTGRGEPRIAFGLDDLSLFRAMRALRTLGLDPKVYGDGCDQAIHFPKQAMKFRELVGPHLHNSLQYKVPFESEGQAVHRKAREAAPVEQVATLYRGGMSKSEIADLLGVGSSTIGRRLLVAGCTQRRPGPRSGFYDLETSTEMLRPYDVLRWPHLTSEDQSRWVEDIMRILRHSQFPIPSEPSQEDALLRLGDVKSAPMSLDGQQIMPVRHIGNDLCLPFFPNRYRAASDGRTSAWEAWHDDQILEKAIRFQLKMGDPVVPHRVLRAITMMHRTPSIFRPTVARFIYDTFCPNGGVTWDPCAGYGGRLLGAVAAGVHYIGTDVEPDTVSGNLRLAAVLGTQDVEIHLCDASLFQPSCALDLVFTSPPYFDRERYSSRNAQSWVQHPDVLTWVEGFLRPVMRTARTHMKPDGFMIFNIADIKKRGKMIPLRDLTVQAALETGWVLSQELMMPLPALNREDPKEPVLVFRKV